MVCATAACGVAVSGWGRLMNCEERVLGRRLSRTMDVLEGLRNTTNIIKFVRNMTLCNTVTFYMKGMDYMYSPCQ